MPRIAYLEKNFAEKTLEVIGRANAICAAYRAQGFDLTLRQLYYQFVARGLIANKDTEYDRLGSIINDARLAGLLDWAYITDRTRNIQSLSHFETPAEIVEAVSEQFNLDRWHGQRERVEVWIEKDALVGVIQGAARRNDVPYFSCRGYTSQSEMWGAAQRIEGYLDEGAETVTIIHLGDHDPSGIDMTRDIESRIRLFLNGDGYNGGDEHDSGAFEIERIALNMDQIRQYNPPPNPAKLTDSRVGPYIARFGSQSWELDALDPTTLDALVEAAIVAHRDDDLWAGRSDEQATHRRLLASAARRWDDVAALVDDE